MTLQEGNRCSHTSCSTLSEQDAFEERGMNKILWSPRISFGAADTLLLWKTRRDHQCHTVDTGKTRGVGAQAALSQTCENL